jgi:hypothetical protein
MLSSERDDELIGRLISEQRACWSAGDKRPIEDYIRQYPELLENVDGLLDLIYSEYCLREECGEEVRPNDYASRFPQHIDRLGPLFSLHKAMGAMSTEHRDSPGGDGSQPVSDVRLADTVERPQKEIQQGGNPSSKSGRLQIRCPSCNLEIEVPVDTMFAKSSIACLKRIDPRCGNWPTKCLDMSCANVQMPPTSSSTVC